MSSSATPSRATGARQPALLLFRAYQDLAQGMLDGLAKAGFADLRASHLPVLQYLQPAGSRVTELAEQVRIATPSVVYLVNYLVDHRYVERVSDPLDGRAVLVRRTERGWAADRVLHEVAGRSMARWRQCLGEAAVEQLLASLERLADAAPQAPPTVGSSRRRRSRGE